MPNVLARTAAALPLLIAASALAGCSGTPAQPTTTVTVRIAPSAHPAAYEVLLHRTSGDYRAVHTMRSGERRTFAVPKGWLTVRIPGLCVVPTPGDRGTVIDVDAKACTIV